MFKRVFKFWCVCLNYRKKKISAWLPKCPVCVRPETKLFVCFCCLITIKMVELLYWRMGGSSGQSKIGQHSLSSTTTQFTPCGPAHWGETQAGKPFSHVHVKHLSTFQRSPFWYTVPSSVVHVVTSTVCKKDKKRFLRKSLNKIQTNGWLVLQLHIAFLIIILLIKWPSG